MPWEYVIGGIILGILFSARMKFTVLNTSVKWHNLHRILYMCSKDNSNLHVKNNLLK